MAYEPQFPPEDLPENARVYLFEEFRKLSAEIALLELVEYTAAPEKVFHKMRVLADGTNWDPGSGRGIYWYDEVTASWKLLG